MKFGDLHYMNRHDRRVLMVLLTVGALLAAIAFFVGGEDLKPAETSATSVTGADSTANDSAAAVRHKTEYYRVDERPVERFYFDPNTADSTQLLRLGLQPWMVRNIYKYRAAGGVFRRKEDFARVYGLTVKQYRELEPYIRISSDYQPASTIIKGQDTEKGDTVRRPKKIEEGETVDLNAGDTAVYKKVPGVGSYYARKIMEYGERLGGYVSIDQMDEIDDLPPEVKAYFAVNTTSPRRCLNVNRLSLNELKRHPYINYYQARAIIDHRRLYGLLHSLEELRLLPDFSDDDIRRLKPYVCFD